MVRRGRNYMTEHTSSETTPKGKRKHIQEVILPDGNEKYTGYRIGISRVAFRLVLSCIECTASYPKVVAVSGHVYTRGFIEEQTSPSPTPHPLTTATRII